MARKMKHTKHMTKYIVHQLLLKMLVGLLWGLFICLAGGDEIHHVDGRIISGTITDEDDHRIDIETEEYGTLVFDKANLKKIVYTSEPHLTAPPSPSPTASSSMVPSATPPLPSVNLAMQDTAVPPKPQPSSEGLAPLSVLTGNLSASEEASAEPEASPITPAPSPVTSTLELLPLATPERPTIEAGFDAVLFDVVKSVKVRRRGQEWEAAKEGLQMKVGDEIYTGEGKTKIRLRGRGELRLPPSSHLIIVTLNREGTQITIELTGGRVWNNVTPGGGAVNYTVKTPDLVAGVRGTLFKVSTAPTEGSRVAVFEGEVLTVSEKTQEQITVAPNTFVTVDQEGQLSQPAAVDPEEREEWDEWDEWALDVHNQIASRFVFGGQQIDALARQIAEDGKRYDRIMNEANQRILYNREGDKLFQFRDVFIQFYKDTGHIPSTDEGFQVLLQNPDIQNWNGPYLASEDLLTDRWGSAITYEKKQSAATGNVYGELISPGPDKIHSKGSPATDDIKVLILYFTVTR